MENNTSTLAKREELIKNGSYKVAVNSIQRTLFVERLYVNITYPADRIIPYDRDNLYPNKIKSIAQRSGTTSSAIGTLSAFISGEGFTGMNTVINRDGKTLWDVLRHISTSLSMFGGYALHFNFNMLGQVVEINCINFEFIRWSKDLKKFVVNPDWARRNRRREEVDYYPFCPEEVLNQIAECGIDEYRGQLCYWIPNISDYYAPCNWDSVLDDAQFEAEAKLYSLSSIQNDYSLAGIISYPKNIVDQGEINDLKDDIRGDTGSNNAGGVRVVGALPSENLTNWKWFTPISRNNIDGLHTNQIERAKFNIYAAFRQPPILNGVATQGMFNEASFADAFHYYNSQTETERKIVEKELDKILKISVWPMDVKIMPKTFYLRTEPPKPNEGDLEPQAEVNNTLTNLTGRQLQGIFRITKNYKKGGITFDQAATLLKNGFGLNEDQINIWLVNDDGDGE